MKHLRPKGYITILQNPSVITLVGRKIAYKLTDEGFELLKYYSLERISFGYLVQVEFFFIKLFGWEPVERQFNTFYEELDQNLKICPENLTKRFNIYENYLSD